MASVLILQFMDDDAPAYLGSWLRGRGITADVRLAEQGLGFPECIAGYSALALLGGAMSVNDDLPYLRTAQSLVAQAIAADVPVLGHCLGGQLMARTLGARVGASPAPEVGWHRMDAIDSSACRDWLGLEPSHRVFHWHYEAFDLPAGAVPLARSANCPHQAFAIGRHLAMQFHVEVDAAKLALWLTMTDAQYQQARQRFPTVHGVGRMRGDEAACLPAQQRLADRIYARWLGLREIS